MPLPDDVILDEESLDLLSQVELQEFTANPQQILPFAASRLRWRVNTPETVRFELNSTSVPANRERLVTPANTQTYTLKAKRGRHARVLGRVTVQVDLAACETDEHLRIDDAISGLLDAAVDTDLLVYFRMIPRPYPQQPYRATPILSFTSSTVKAVLKLQAVVDDAPDPNVDLTLTFGVSVQNGEIVAVTPDVHANVSVPWWVWLIPGAPIWLPIRLGNAEDRARAGGREMIAGIIELLNMLVAPGEGRRLHSVSFEVNGNEADLVTVHCPDAPLQALVQRDVAGTTSTG